MGSLYLEPEIEKQFVELQNYPKHKFYIGEFVVTLLGKFYKQFKVVSIKMLEDKDGVCAPTFCYTLYNSQENKILHDVDEEAIMTLEEYRDKVVLNKPPMTFDEQGAVGILRDRGYLIVEPNPNRKAVDEKLLKGVFEVLNKL